MSLLLGSRVGLTIDQKWQMFQSGAYITGTKTEIFDGHRKTCGTSPAINRYLCQPNNCQTNGQRLTRKNCISGFERLKAIDDNEMMRGYMVRETTLLPESGRCVVYPSDQCLIKYRMLAFQGPKRRAMTPRFRDSELLSGNTGKHEFHRAAAVLLLLIPHVVLSFDHQKQHFVL